MTKSAEVAQRFAAVAPPCDFWSVRVMGSTSECLAVTRGVADPVALSNDVGAMVTVHAGGGLGYAATSDISASGLRRAGGDALAWAQRSAGRMVSPLPQ